jgi:hypothetical protein
MNFFQELILAIFFFLVYTLVSYLLKFSILKKIDKLIIEGCKNKNKNKN